MSSTFRPSGKQTVVEEGSSFKGTLTSSCPIHVHGRVEGELDAPSLVVSATGAVHGKAKVGEVRSQGELSGEFDADTVELAGTVRDNTVIRARSLEVKLGSQRGKLQVIFGECELSVGDAPTEHDMVDAPAEQAVAAAPQPEVMPPLEAPAPTAPESLAEAVAAAAAAEMPAASAEMPALAAEMPAGPALEVSESGDGDDSVDDADGDSDEEAEAEAGAEIEAEAGAEATGGGRRRRRKRNKQDDTGPSKTGWSHPPSQPPPAN